jgi:Spy/CpxP family protein refolding chaperone
MFVSEVQGNSVVEAVAGQQLIHETWGEITTLLGAKRTDDAAVRHHAEYAQLLGPDAMERMVRTPHAPPSATTPAARPRWPSDVSVTHGFP